MIKKILLYIVFAIPSLVFGFFAYFYNGVDMRSSITGALALLILTYLGIVLTTGDLGSKKVQTTIQEEQQIKHIPPTPVEDDETIFIKKLIAGTKNGKLKWELAISDKLINKNFNSYYLQKGNNRLVIEKYYANAEYGIFKDYPPTIFYNLSVRDNSYNQISIMAHKRLYTLYEAIMYQINHVDDIMEDFVSEIV